MLASHARLGGSIPPSSKDVDDNEAEWLRRWIVDSESVQLSIALSAGRFESYHCRECRFRMVAGSNPAGCCNTNTRIYSSVAERSIAGSILFYFILFTLP